MRGEMRVMRMMRLTNWVFFNNKIITDKGILSYDVRGEGSARSVLVA